MTRLAMLAAIAVLGATLAAGCTHRGTVIDHRSNGTAQYSATVLRQAAKGDGLYVDIRNLPFPGADRATVERIVTQALQESYYGAHDVRFRTDRAETDGDSVVVLFNPAEGARLETLCTRSDQPTTEPGGRTLGVALALCQPDEPYRWLRARRAGVTGVGEPGFRTLIQDAGGSLFRQDDPGSGNPDGTFM